MKKSILVPVLLFSLLVFGWFGFTRAQSQRDDGDNLFPDGILIYPSAELAEAVVVKDAVGHTVFQLSSGGDQGAVLRGFFDLAGDFTLITPDSKLGFGSVRNFIKADDIGSGSYGGDIGLGYGAKFSAGWTDAAFGFRRDRIFGADQIGAPNTFLIGGGIASNYRAAFVGQAATGTITFVDAANPPHFWFDKGVAIGGQIRNSNLAGSGSAYVCVDAEGVLFRSVSPCV